MSESAKIEIGHAIRTKCGRGRITYRPDWSPSYPWLGYRNGTVGACYASPEAAKADGFDLESDAERTARLAALDAKGKKSP